MALYIFILHNPSEDPSRTEIECVDDKEALMTAGHMSELGHVDVWREGKIIGLVPRRSSPEKPR